MSQVLSEYKDKSFSKSMDFADLKNEVNNLLRFLNKIPDDIIEKVKHEELERRKMRGLEKERGYYQLLKNGTSKI